MRRPLPDGTTHLLFAGLGLLRRVASLVPPPWTNLTRFHGVFAPGAQLRPFLVPQAGEAEGSVVLRNRPANDVPRGLMTDADRARRAPRGVSCSGTGLEG
ncbi:transposase [Corallococcus sp. AS-1-6]|nr:transposase [Corallococcus sp. AS-1-6]